MEKEINYTLIWKSDNSEEIQCVDHIPGSQLRWNCIGEIDLCGDIINVDNFLLLLKNDEIIYKNIDRCPYCHSELKYQRDHLIELQSYAIEYEIGKYVIWERYNRKKDKYNYGNPCIEAQTEPMFGISNERGSHNICYSKSIKEFIYIHIPSNRTDEEIRDTSFTLEQAYQIVFQLNKKGN